VSEPLFVDPENLAQHARPYQAASHEWNGVRDTVAGIRNRYNGAWGDDDLGNNFGPSFLEGMDALEMRAGGVAETLNYYGEGLVENGRIFGDARDDADQTSHLFLLDTEYTGGYEAPPGAVYFGVESVQPLQRATLFERARVVEGRPLVALRREQAPLLRGRLVEGRHLLARRLNAEISEPALPLRAMKRVRGEPILPLEPTHQSRFYRSVNPLEAPELPVEPLAEPLAEPE